jgi:hypothetical protein
VNVVNNLTVKEGFMSTYVLICALVLGALFASPPSALADSRLVNLSTRAQVGLGAAQVIAGFIIEGSAPRTVLLRVLGPSLTGLGVPGALANPVLQLFSGQTVLV